MASNTVAQRVIWVLMVLFAVVFLGISGNTIAAEHYVSPDGNGTGTKKSPWSLSQANQAAKPGDTIILLDGTYTKTPINPARSGKKGKRIIYRAANQHKAFFKDIKGSNKTNGATVVFFGDKSYLTVDGIKSAGVKRWLISTGGSYLTIENCHFENGSGWQNVRLRRMGNGIVARNNYFHGGTDLFVIDGGDQHLIENNFFGNASHTGLVLLGVQRSVVRGNRLTNREWRCMEVETQRHEPHRLSKYNLIEKNTFFMTPGSSIQYAGNSSILRRNIFRRCLNGFGWANYLGSNKGPKKRSPEAWYNEHNRFYNNVIADSGSNELVLKDIADAKAKGIKVAESVGTGGFGMSFATNMKNPKYGDNIVVNSIFYHNTNTQMKPDKKGVTSMPSVQIAFRWDATPKYGRFFNNAFVGKKIGQPQFYWTDAAYAKPVEPRNRTVKEFEKRYPKWAQGNLDVQVKFVAPAKGNFRLKLGSPGIDAGRMLSHTTQTGKGTIIPVADVLYFSDGHGIVDADVLRVGKERVTIQKIDYKTNRITIDRAIVWKKDTPVTLDYKGKAPDIGAFEF